MTLLFLIIFRIEVYLSLKGRFSIYTFHLVGTYDLLERPSSQDVKYCKMFTNLGNFEVFENLTERGHYTIEGIERF